MLFDLTYPRDLLFIGALFGVAAFAWSGWAQERPPNTVWRAVLGVLSLGGLALAGVSIPVLVRHWSAATAMSPGTAAFRWYLIAFWVEVLVAAALSFWAVRSGRPGLIAPVVLGTVGIHFFPLAVVLHQPLLTGLAAVLTIVAIGAALLAKGNTAPSFWCGLLAAPGFLAVGAWALTVGKADVGS